MSSDVARKADHIVENEGGLGTRVSSDTFTKELYKEINSSPVRGNFFIKGLITFTLLIGPNLAYIACFDRCTLIIERSKQAMHAKLGTINREFMQSSVSAYSLADDRSLFSHDIDRWMTGNTTSSESAAVQSSRAPMVQRSTLARSSSLDRSGIWYVLAMVLPLFSINTCCAHWRCTPSMVINTAELCIAHVSRVCGRARAHIRQLAHDQMARELFATAMDIVLVIYAIGFLVLSMYQASIFG